MEGNSTNNVYSDSWGRNACVRLGDERTYRDREARVKVQFNVSTISIYNILTGQKYNSAVGIKLDIILTGQQYCYSSETRLAGLDWAHLVPLAVQT